MNRYQSYKPSGVEWIGEIPSNWSVTKIKYTKKDSKDSFIDGDWIESKDLSDEGIRYITSGNIGEGRYKEQGSGYISEDTFKELNCTEIFEGDLVISRLFLPVGRSCILPNLNNNRVITCVDNVVLRPKESFNKSYLNYQFNSNRYSEFTELISRGVTLTRISRGMLGNNSIVVPPLQEQLQIVQFLDEKTELIDKLISTKEQKITLLKEQRTSLINEVVTKGLNPNVKMKDSGVEWIGEIPEHWGLIKMKHKGDVIIGLSYSPEDIVDEGDGTLVMRSSNVQNGKPSFLDNVYVSTKIPEKIRLKIGDILICSRNGSRNLIGKNCLITKNEEGLTFGVFMTVYRSRHYKFMYWLLNSPIFESQSGLFLTSTINQLTVSTLQNMVLPFTDNENEQNQIVEYLDSKTKEINDLVQLEQKKIDLLKEYRQSLISEVVTGKIKVTTDE